MKISPDDPWVGRTTIPMIAAFSKSCAALVATFRYPTPDSIGHTASSDLLNGLLERSARAWAALNPNNVTSRDVARVLGPIVAELHDTLRQIETEET